MGHGLEDFVLAVHELVTNVVRHGGGSGEVRLFQHSGLLTCQVSDDGPGLGEVDVALPSPGEVGHRGLWLAQQLTKGLMVDRAVAAGVERGKPVEQIGAVGAGCSVEGVEDGEEVAHLVEGSGVTQGERVHDRQARRVSPSAAWIRARLRRKAS
ncbi:ATP-binding protein [Micromonospora sp. DT178]|uniref:ATP-binding protein n=1 Tax=Micromonospora sp. DT178 TaxID=3393436 RepID=UPI003CFA210D